MVRHGIILLSIFLLLYSSLCTGQDREEYNFPPESAGFIAELNNFLKIIPEKNRKKIITSFNSFADNYQPEENEWIELASLTNILIKRGIKPYPQFTHFLEMCISFQNSKLDRLSLINLLSHIRLSLEKEGQTLAFVEQLWLFAQDFNSSNVLFNSGSVKWTIDGVNYSMQSDTALYLAYESAILTGRAANEESLITNTKGKYYPSYKLFCSESGEIDWTSTGIAADKLYAELGHFQINLSRSGYSLDSVRLFDTRYFKTSLLGRLENKIATGRPINRRGYPKFTSYNQKNLIKNIYPNMDYTGGYALQGSKVIGANINNQKGTLLVYYKNQPKIRLASDYFVFTPERAQGVNTEVSIYLESDSIFHPGLSFQYQHDRKEMALMRDGRGLSNSRFFNNYHNLDLDVEMIVWNPDDSIMVLSGMFGSLQNRADFESADYYSIERFNEIQVADRINPLIRIKQCADHYNSRYFTIGDLSEFMNRPHHLIVEMLLNVSFLGFVRYDMDSDMVEVTQRTFDFLAKHAELQDYDIIQFRSDMKPPKPNAYLNLISGNLKIDGVSKVNLSTERNVTAFPANYSINIQKNLNIQFDGFLQGGLVGFTGTGFSLNYDEFKINIEHIESIRIKVHIPINDSYNETEIKNISSIIENTSGSILIDHPSNKSGIMAEDYPEYPIFIADTIAYVYYDQAFIQNGAYKRENFYFSSDSLVIAGLNSIDLKDNLSFEGKFNTADIFPEILVDLKYREDQSLGFATLFTPDTGYQIYDGKGRFYNEINMSNEGLTGNGILEYLGASMQSGNFLFLPDKMKSLVESINIQEDLTDSGSPKIAARNVDISWRPAEDLMISNQKAGLMSLYDNANFDGDIYIEPGGLKGNGKLQMSNFAIESTQFTFFKKSLTADEAIFSILSQFQDTINTPEGKENPDLIAMNSLVHIDLSDSVAFIQPEQENSIIRFPENKFRTSFETMDWRIGSDKVQLNQLELVSEHPPHNGLSFESQSAKYDLNNYQLDLMGLEYIDIADVRIFPEKKALTIRTNAFIDSLPACTIIPRDTSLIHIIKQSLVYLNGKNNYRAKGMYTYLDKAQREFIIEMLKISVNSQGISYGQGQINQSDRFFLSPDFAFQGSASLTMNEPLLKFDGSFQLTHDCTSTTKRWIRMNEKIDPLSVIIPIDTLTPDSEGRKIYSGFFLSNQPIELYSTFLGPHTRYSDYPVIQSMGFVRFDDLSGEYRLASTEKLNNPDLIQTEVRLDRDNCMVTAEGKMNLGLDLGQIRLDAAGSALHDMKTDSILIHTVMSLDFFMSEKALDYMAKELNNFTQAQPVNYSDQGFRRSLLYYLGSESGQEVLNQLSLTGGFRKLPIEFNHTLLFTHLDLKWNPERGSYQSVGKIGIGNIQDRPVNKVFNGNLEIIHRRGGDTFTLYIETDPGSYFFFYYSRGLMQVLAGPKYEKFNNIVRDTKEAKRKLPSDGDKPAYQYYLGQYRLVRNFLDQNNRE